MNNVNIKKGSKTAEHAATLQAINAKLPEQLRYKLTEDATHLKVSCQGIVEVVEASGEDNAAICKAVVEQVASKGKMLTYSSQVRTPEGKVFSSLPLCGKLGALSALVGKAEGAAAKKNKANLDDLLAGM